MNLFYHRKRKSGAIALSHLFNHRKAQQNKIHWRRQRRVPIPLASTPQLRTMDLFYHRKRKSGAITLSHLFNHRKEQQNKIHWRRQRRVPTPSIKYYLPGNPNNILPIRVKVPPASVPSPKKLMKTTITTDYKISQLGATLF